MNSTPTEGRYRHHPIGGLVLVSPLLSGLRVIAPYGGWCAPHQVCAPCDVFRNDRLASEVRDPTTARVASDRFFFTSNLPPPFRFRSFQHVIDRAPVQLTTDELLRTVSYRSRVPRWSCTARGTRRSRRRTGAGCTRDSWGAPLTTISRRRCGCRRRGTTTSWTWTAPARSWRGCAGSSTPWRGGRTERATAAGAGGGRGRERRSR